MHRRTILVLGLAIACAATAANADAARPPLVVGQVWSVKAEPSTSAKVVIDRIEEYGGHTAVHVSLIDVPVPPGLVIRQPTMSLPHLPFDAEALAGSLDKLVATGASPVEHFEEGYAQWKAAKGGIFTISVPQAIEIVFKSVPKAP
jgi:hypothetical protein